MKSKIQAINQIHALLVTAPEHIKARYYISLSHRRTQKCKLIQSPLDNVI
ncbi:hypothetical protein PPAR_a0909 [Pseudoalteromonas paragorgicola KMM 3548]|nr:hypothetical protein [Pseudoalteromonas distincta KMM 3548]